MEEDGAQAGGVGRLLDFVSMFSIIRPIFFHVSLRLTSPSLIFFLGWFLLLLFFLLFLLPSPLQREGPSWSHLLRLHL